MATLRDKPRPSVYWPNTPSQWREPTVDDCTWYAVEFAFQAASDNHVSMHPVNDLRNHSIDRTGGTQVRVALSEVDRLWPKGENVGWKYGVFSKTEIRRRLKDGATIVWGGDYEKLPQHYRRWTVNDYFNHAMASRDFRINPQSGKAQTFLYDPLGGGPQRDFYDGEWINLEALYRFNWNNEEVGIVYNIGRKTDKMIRGPIERTSSKWVHLPAGVRVFDAPGGQVVRTVGNAKRYDYFGYSNGFWAIEIFVQGEPVIAYVKKNQNFERGNWPEPEPVNPPDEDRQQLLDRISALEISLAAETNRALEAETRNAELEGALVDIETIVETTLVNE